MMRKQRKCQSSSSSSSNLIDQHHHHLLIVLMTLMVVTQNVGFLRVVEGGKMSRVHIPDELDDVIDDEEDDAWKDWGKKRSSSSSKEFDPPSLDLSKMEMSQIQAEMMKRHSGPSFGFVKLQLGVRRSPDMVGEIAMKWTKVLKTGSIDAKFMGVDVSTIMFTMEKGQDTMELIEFVLSQPEAYEIKIGDQIHRRPGDPPLDEVMETLHNTKQKVDDASPIIDLEVPKDEL
ncbi:hypothetical protein BVC80_9027g46 [Macleaya cordata]|uniref:Mesoderm development candidate 2 n=1 Tax=Macleaya cordata TaxID=56857 RepID=A0A200QV21_MACCD|nr:hypothetical protein BVC80_9027g46 [Macleaya cordata]